MEAQLTELRRLAAAAENRRTETGIPRVAMVRGAVPAHNLNTVYEPMINLILQGGKTMTIGDTTLRYDPATYFVMSMDLPALGTVHADSTGADYMATSLTLEPRRIADLLADLPPAPPSAIMQGFSVAAVTPELLDAWVRMLRLMETPQDIAVLAPGYEREILYRVLQGPQGAMLRAIASPETNLARVNRAVEWIRQNVDKPLRIENLADIANMSPSAFHRHFKQATALSPVQFQKQLRLLAARLMLIGGATSVTEVCFEVGYVSIPQFTREYSRMFGAPPSRDPVRGRGAGKPGQPAFASAAFSQETRGPHASR